MAKYSKVRKNASKKIAAMLDQATKFEIESHSMGLDDCMNSNGFVEVSRAEVEQFMIDNYNRLCVEAGHNGEELVSLEIADGPYYFSTRIMVRFEEAQEEAVEVEAPNAEAVVAKSNVIFVNFVTKTICTEEESLRALEVEEDDSKVITGVRVEWSESYEFDGVEGRTIGPKTYQAIASRVAVKENEEQAYCKTKVWITTKDGNEYQFRHDINLNHTLLSTEWAAWVDYCNRGAKAQ